MSGLESPQSFVIETEKTYGRQLRRFLSMRLRHSSADVHDLMQEIYLRLLRLNDQHAIRNLQAYLYTIARHVLHQHLLQQKKMPTMMDPLDVVQILDLQHEVTFDPAEEVEIEQKIQMAGRALEKHSPRAFATFVMYRCENLTFKQIGERLGVSSVMARKYLISAIQFLDVQMNGRQDLP